MKTSAYTRVLRSFFCCALFACSDPESVTDAGTADASELDAGDSGAADTFQPDALEPDASAPDASAPDPIGELKAFPSALGAGAYVTGGRGGQVIHVTTLDWEAPGGLQEAIQTTGPRTIVFDVSGVIDMTSRNRGAIINGAMVGGGRTSDWDNMTIAGQTAPEGGITLQGGNFVIRDVNNVIIRYLRFRNGGETTQNDDAFSFAGSRDLIVDHCTVSHGGDEAIEFTSGAVERDETNFTLQYSFLQDSKTGAIFGDCTQGTASEVSTLRNLWSNISHRFPNTCGIGQHDVINNVIYNHKNRALRLTGAHDANVINNYYATSDQGIRQPSWFSDGSIRIRMNKIQVTDDAEHVTIYSAGTYITGERTSPMSDDRDLFTAFVTSTVGEENDQVPDRYFVDAPYDLLGAPYEILSAEDAYALVAAEAGAIHFLNADGSVGFFRDPKDTADVQTMRDDSYSGEFYTARDSIPYPVIPSNTRPDGFDTDRDGMPDEWENLVGLDPDADDSADDRNDDGYTNLEEYLYQVDL